MSLPVSQYEALLAEVRNIKHKAQKVQQLANPLISNISRINSSSSSTSYSNNFHYQHDKPLDYTMESPLFRRQREKSRSPSNYDGASSSSSSSNHYQHHRHQHHRTTSDLELGTTSDGGGGGGGGGTRRKGTSTYSQISVSSEPVPRLTTQEQNDSSYYDSWSKKNMWNSEPASLGTISNSAAPVTSSLASAQHYNLQQQRAWISSSSNSNGNSCLNDVSSVISFASSSGAVPLEQQAGALSDGSTDQTKYNSSHHLRAKMDVVHGLLSMLGSQEHVDMGETLLALSTCPESCMAMRQSGCISLLVQLVQSDKDCETRRKAAQALHNLVNSQTDQKIRKRETRILTLLEHARTYIECLKNNTDCQDGAAAAAVTGATGGVAVNRASPCTLSVPGETSSEDGAILADDEKHPVQTIAHLMKLSFDENHRQAICQLGGIHTIAKLVEMEHYLHSDSLKDSQCILMRRYSCMALTNLTFGDSGNKALLCSFKEFMTALIIQLQSPSDELRQVTASVLRNLSWRADSSSKEILREKNSVTALVQAAMLPNKENTLKSILSALWNLSAHCADNKAQICSMDGALGFLVSMLTYKTPSKSWAIIENAGGILRNVSSQIALRDDYREILRQHNCLQILLDQLKSPSLTIVANACGTLWNLSAKNAQDQETLWQMGAPALLRSLNHSKHKMIAMGSSAALKNLLTFKPNHSLKQHMDATALSLNLTELPTLGMRKQKALMKDLDQSLSETYENIEKETSPPGKTRNESRKMNINEFLLDKTSKQQQHSDHTMSDLNNAFCSLNLNEPVSNNYRLDTDRKSKLSQCYNSGGSYSLPYCSTTTSAKHYTNPKSFLSTRGKYQSEHHDDRRSNNSDNDIVERSREQPIDYSRKYAESKRFQRNELQNNNDGTNNVGYSESVLDQLTDYSLKYAENETDDLDICGKITKQEFVVQDTLKTYYTENTPYETPYIISNATSISDLRHMVVNDDEEKCRLIDNDLQTNKMDTKPPKQVEVTNIDDDEEKDRCSTEDISSKIESVAASSTLHPDMKLLKFEANSSGSMSPEKPVNYCEEGTPGYFSRVSSFGSGLDLIEAESEPLDDVAAAAATVEPLGTISASQDVEVKKEKEKQNVEVEEEAAACALDIDGINKEKESLMKSEIKVVKFEQNVDYTEETPLVFSRSSSLGSLDSIEQHSIHDDRSSIVSDFSRLTSGIVSPSELPDSPTQTIPPSPRPPPSVPLPRPPINTATATTTPTTSSSSNRLPAARKQMPAEMSNQQQHFSRPKNSGGGGCGGPASGVLQKRYNTHSVFEDNVRKFKQENTPIEFSAATSLSSLLIDDETDENQLAVVNQIAADIETSSSSLHDVEKEKNDYCMEHEKRDAEKDTADITGSDDDISEGDENILAACINEGMQLNISTTNSASSKLSSSLSNFKYSSTTKASTVGSTNSTTGSTGIPLMRRTPPRKIPTSSSAATAATGAATCSNILDDAPKTYCTEDTPAELSRIGSNSNLSTLSFLNDNKSSKQSDFSDESSNMSSGENDNILLAECIQSAMPAAKPAQVHRITNISNPKQLPSALPRYNIQPLKRYAAAHSLSSSQSVDATASTSSTEIHGRPPPPTATIATKLSETALRERRNKAAALPPYLLVKDELESYVVEDSPYQFSLKSSLSDLTIDHESGGGGARKKELPSSSVKETIPQQPESEEVKAKESSSSIDSSEEQALLEECIYAGMPIDKHEEALLKECIQAGMPKNSIRSNLARIGTNPSTEQGQSSEKQQSSSRRDSDDLLGENQLVGNSSSKNVEVASVAGITANDHHYPDISTTVAAGVEDIASNRNDTAKNVLNKSELMTDHIKAEVVELVPQAVAVTTAVANTVNTIETAVETLADNYLKLEDNCSIEQDQMKNGSKTTTAAATTPPQQYSDNDLSYSDSDNCANIDNVFAKSCEESGNLMDNRMLDPDAMIESLDRFTAELVSQASHLTNNKQTPGTISDKSQHGMDNTWNEDTSHEITLASISGSVPNVITFDSENDEEQIPNQKELEKVEINTDEQTKSTDNVDGRIIKPKDETEQSLDFSSIPTQTTMTASTLIEIEANRMAKVFELEAEMSQSLTSVASLPDLDLVQPPSQLNSLMNSGTNVHPQQSPKLLRRKKSLPGGSFIKQALTNSTTSSRNHGFGSLENNMDIDSSEERQHPIFDVKQPFMNTSVNLSSLNATDLDLVNPPSLFNEVTDLCGSASLADVPTEVIGTEVSIFEDCFSQIDNTLQDEQTNFSDANSTTPIQTDQSSAEGTPIKKLPAATIAKPLSKSMMTKQRRNKARDRYKTYTVAVEMVMQESIEMELKSKHHQPEADNDTTYTVENAAEEIPPDVEQRENGAADVESSAVRSRSSSASSTPTRTKMSIKKDFLQKRQENKERFKTQILNDSIMLLHSTSESPPLPLPGNVNDIHYLVQQEADLVLKTLKDNSYLQDEMLDCETLSLVSNDEENEQLSGCSSTQMFSYKTYHKSWGTTRPNLPVVDADINQTSPSPRGGLDTPPELPSPAIDSEVESIPSSSKLAPKGMVKIVKSANSNNNNNVQPCEAANKAIRGRRKPLYSKSNVTTKMSPKMIKPARTMNSTIVTNVTSTFKTSGASLKNIVASNKQQQQLKPTRSALPPPSKPGVTVSGNKNKPKSSGYGYRGSNSASTTNSGLRPKSTMGIPSKNPTPRYMSTTAAKGTTPLERQGTFTKDETSGNNSTKVPTKIPTASSRIPALTVNGKSSNSKIATSIMNRGGKYSITKSASSDRANRNPKVYNRSTSADCREPLTKRIQPSTSTHSLKGDVMTKPLPLVGVAKRSIPAPSIPTGSTQRCASSASLASTGSGASTPGGGSGTNKKQVNSKIASLWKKVEESKVKQQTQKDKRIWIQNGVDQTKKPSSTESNQLQLPPQSEPATGATTATTAQLIRSNTFENKSGIGILLRNKPLPPPSGPSHSHLDGNEIAASTKRTSRLGLFLVNGQSDGSVEDGDF